MPTSLFFEHLCSVVQSTCIITVARTFVTWNFHNIHWRVLRYMPVVCFRIPRFRSYSWVKSDHHVKALSHYCIHRRSSCATFFTLLNVWESGWGVRGDVEKCWDGYREGCGGKWREIWRNVGGGIENPKTFLTISHISPHQTPTHFPTSPQLPHSFPSRPPTFTIN